MTMENDKILETLQKEIAALQELLDQIQPDCFKQYLRQIFSGQIVPPYFVVAILNTYNIQAQFYRF